MKILFFGDSITDAGRERSYEDGANLGTGYVPQIAGRLSEKSPTKYTVINRGISGDRIVDLYARVKRDVWAYTPDLISILVGVNDVWHEIQCGNGVEPDRFEKVYRMLLEDTKKVLPNVKIVLCEPYFTHGTATDPCLEQFEATKDYAAVAKKLAEEQGCYFLPLQSAIDSAYERHGGGIFFPDGVHPSIHGASLIASEWLKLFEKIETEI